MIRRHPVIQIKNRNTQPVGYFLAMGPHRLRISLDKTTAMRINIVRCPALSFFPGQIDQHSHRQMSLPRDLYGLPDRRSLIILLLHRCLPAADISSDLFYSLHNSSRLLSMQSLRGKMQ